jgi:hypothetical protein
MPPTNHRTQPDHCSSGAGSTVGNRSSAPGRSDAIEPTLRPQPDFGNADDTTFFSGLSHLAYLILTLGLQHTGSDSASSPSGPVAIPGLSLEPWRHARETRTQAAWLRGSGGLAGWRLAVCGAASQRYVIEKKPHLCMQQPSEGRHTPHGRGAF